MRKAPALKIEVDYTTLDNAKRLKAFLEESRNGQKRSAAIRATRSQMYEAANVFESGVEWIPVAE